MNLRHFSMLVRAPVKNRRHPSSGNSAMKIVYDLATAILPLTAKQGYAA